MQRRSSAPKLTVLDSNGQVVGVSATTDPLAPFERALDDLLTRATTGPAGR